MILQPLLLLLLLNQDHLLGVLLQLTQLTSHHSLISHPALLQAEWSCSLASLRISPIPVDKHLRYIRVAIVRTHILRHLLSAFVRIVVWQLSQEMVRCFLYLRVLGTLDPWQQSHLLLRLSLLITGRRYLSLRTETLELLLELSHGHLDNLPVVGNVQGW